MRWKIVSTPTSSPEPGARSRQVRAWVKPCRANSSPPAPRSRPVDQVEDEHVGHAGPQRDPARRRRRQVVVEGDDLLGQLGRRTQPDDPVGVEHPDHRSDALDVALDHGA